VFRTFQEKVQPNGIAVIHVTPITTAMEWDIYQISIKTQIFWQYTQAEVQINGFFVCGSPQGSLDTATGPPDLVLKPGDDLTITWINASPGDLALVGIWYNENPVGTTVSFSH
jgi:hypothetical protein